MGIKFVGRGRRLPLVLMARAVWRAVVRGVCDENEPSTWAPSQRFFLTDAIPSRVREVRESVRKECGHPTSDADLGGFDFERIAAFFFM